MLVARDFVVHTCCFHLFIAHKELASTPFSNAHSLTEGSQDPVVFFFFPNVQKWLAVLLFEIIVFRKTKVMY